MWAHIVRAIEQVLIDTLEEFGIAASRIPKLTGVWTRGEAQAKIAAIGFTSAAGFRRTALL